MGMRPHAMRTTKLPLALLPKPSGPASCSTPPPSAPRPINPPLLLLPGAPPCAARARRRRLPPRGPPRDRAAAPCAHVYKLQLPHEGALRRLRPRGRPRGPPPDEGRRRRAHPRHIQHPRLRSRARRDGRQGEAIPRRHGRRGALSGRHYLHLAHERDVRQGRCARGDALGALALLEEMKAKGCEPNERTYNTLLMGLCKNRKLDKAVEVYNSMVGAGMKLETQAYATFVRALCRAGRVPDAYEVFGYSIESKSFAEVTAYSELESSLKWLRRMKA